MFAAFLLINHIHIIINNTTTCLPHKFMHKPCFQFLLENLLIPKKNSKHWLCQILEGKQGYYAECENGKCLFIKISIRRRKWIAWPLHYPIRQLHISVTVTLSSLGPIVILLPLGLLYIYGQNLLHLGPLLHLESFITFEASTHTGVKIVGTVSFSRILCASAICEYLSVVFLHWSSKFNFYLRHK